MSIEQDNKAIVGRWFTMGVTALTQLGLLKKTAGQGGGPRPSSAS